MGKPNIKPKMPSPLNTQSFRVRNLANQVNRPQTALALKIPECLFVFVSLSFWIITELLQSLFKEERGESMKQAWRDKSTARFITSDLGVFHLRNSPNRKDKK